MAHQQYGNVVVYTRGGIKINALVMQSATVTVPDRSEPKGIRKEEHLTLAYLDPAFASPILSGSATERAVARAFGIRPLEDNAQNGWSLPENEPEPPTPAPSKPAPAPTEPELPAAA